MMGAIHSASRRRSTGTAFGANWSSGSAVGGEMVSRTGSATYTVSSGVRQTAAAGALRIDYNAASPNALLGVMIEQPTTNLFSSPSDPAGGTWYLANLSVTGGAGTGMDGTNSLKTLTCTTALGGEVVHQAPTFPSMSTVTCIFYIKKGTLDWAAIHFDDNTYSNGASAWFNLATTSLGALYPGGATLVNPVRSIRLLSNGLHELTMTVGTVGLTSVNCALKPTSGDQSYNGTLNGTLLFDSAQFEANTETSFISGSRAAETVELTAANGTYDIVVTDSLGQETRSGVAVTNGKYKVTPRVGNRHVTRVTATPTSTSAPLFEQMGIAFPSFPNGTSNYVSAESTLSLEKLAKTGANSVEIVRVYGQTDNASSTISSVPQTESDSGIIKAIQDAKALGLRVLLKIHVDSSAAGSNRQNFNPTDKTTWFSQYKAINLANAQLLQTYGSPTDIYCFATEMRTLTLAAQRTQWADLIAGVRGVFSGYLTYAAINEEADTVCFWDLVDYIGIDAYPPLGTSLTPTLDDLVFWWNNPNPAVWTNSSFHGLSPVNYYLSIAVANNKPLIFPEMGFTSEDGCAKTMGFYGTGAAADWAEQAIAYESFFRAWDNAIRNNPNGSYFKGAYIWNWETWLQPETKSWIGPIGYTPQNKPAEVVITDWYHRRR